MATEKRLIDANAIDYPEYFYTRERHPDEFIEGFHQGKIDAINDIKALAPTVDAVEIDVLEDWLYEIANNNFGNALCKSCCEIVNRLDGLRVFARERKDNG